MSVYSIAAEVVVANALVSMSELCDGLERLLSEQIAGQVQSVQIRVVFETLQQHTEAFVCKFIFY